MMKQLQNLDFSVELRKHLIIKGHFVYDLDGNL
jgi:hypothetical protein